MGFITIAEETTAPGFWRFDDNAVTLRIRAEDSFRTAEGQFVPAGDSDYLEDDAYVSATCTVNPDRSVFIPSVQLPITQDSIDNPNAKFTGELLPGNGRRNRRISWPGGCNSNGFSIPPQFAPTCSWSDIEL